MKKILLLGDSIRRGYDKYVRDRFVNVAEVYYPNENCMYAEHILRWLHEWKTRLGTGDDVDVVHWNAGHWDTLRLFGDEPVTALEWYVSTIERIQKRIQILYPNAISIFATSTPVRPPEAWPDITKAIRYDEDIVRYNKAAIDVLGKYNVRIDDLYTRMKDVPDSYHSDMVHFYTPEATKHIGDQVTNCLLDALGLDKNDLVDMNNGNDESVPVVGI